MVLTKKIVVVERAVSWASADLDREFVVGCEYVEYGVGVGNSREMAHKSSLRMEISMTCI